MTRRKGRTRVREGEREAKEGCEETLFARMRKFELGSMRLVCSLPTFLSLFCMLADVGERPKCARTRRISRVSEAGPEEPLKSKEHHEVAEHLTDSRYPREGTRKLYLFSHLKRTCSFPVLS